MNPSKNIAKTETSGIGLCLLFFLILTFNLPAQSSYEGLTLLESYQTKTYYSTGSEEHAINMAQRCDNVVSFYRKHIDFEPTVTLLVLSKEDWSKHTNFPVYGMPHYTSSQTLIVAAEDNEFWKSFIPPIDQLPGELAQQIKATYSDEDGNLSMRAFFDLLAIHELGHAFHIQGGLVMQRKWMGELFSNILLHTYIAEQEPELLPELTLFPNMVVSSTDKNELPFTTLNELEANYERIGQQHPNNYGWYQCRWHSAAGNIYDEGGIDVYISLWHTLKNQKEVLDDAALATLLAGQVHQSVADVLLKWEE